MYTRTSCRSDRKFDSCVPLEFLETVSVSSDARNGDAKNAEEEDTVILRSGESEAGCLCLIQAGRECQNVPICHRFGCVLGSSLKFIGASVCEYLRTWGCALTLSVSLVDLGGPGARRCMVGFNNY